MADALRVAEGDSGVPGLLAEADGVRVVHSLSWPYHDPAAIVARILGLDRASVQTGHTTDGGNMPQTLLARTATEIAAGEHDVVLLTGGEAWRTRTAARRAGHDLPWTSDPDDAAPDVLIGGALDMTHPVEVALGIRRPTQVYPLFENALRAEAGRGIAEHQAHLGELYAAFNRVAVDNPNAWDHTPYSAVEIATPSPRNRLVGFPYTKLMCSNEQVDQAAGIIVCSFERAHGLGVPDDRMVFPHIVTEAAAPAVSERFDLWSSPAAAAVGHALWKLTGLGPLDVAHVDLYSCFPSAVQVQAAELGFRLDRQLTVTGGMRFAGGPWNNYVMHSLATMVDVLRHDPGSLGLVGANGGYISKLAVGLYSTDPPSDGFRPESAQAEADAAPRRGVDAEPDGRAIVDSCTVMHERSGDPVDGLLACLMPDGRRAWGSTTDADTLAAMTTEDVIGRTARLRPGAEAVLE